MPDPILVDPSQEPPLPTGTAVPENAFWLLTYAPSAPGVLPPTYQLTTAQAREAIAPRDYFTDAAPTSLTLGVEGQKSYVAHDGVVDLWQYEYGVWVKKLTNLVLNATAGPALPKPAPPTFVSFSDTQAGGSVVLVPANGVPIADYLYRVTATGNYQAVPPDGLIAVDNVAGSVYAYSKATASRQQSDLGVSNAFTAYNTPAPGTTTPAAPTFTGFDDAANTVQLVPASGVPLTDYQYKLGASGTYATAPSDGILSVGASFAGQVFAYSVASGTRNASLTGASPSFTATTTRITPAPPTFTAFDDTANTVQLVPAAGVPLANYLYKVGTAGTYVAVPSNGLLSVPSSFAGQVFAYSVADSTYNASQPAASTAFTAAPGPTPVVPGAPTNLVATATTSSNTPSITVTGLKPSSTGGAAITDYNVYRDGGSTAIGSFPAPSGNTLTYIDSVVVNGAAHTYQFTALNSAGESAKSVASNSATPTAPAPPVFNTTYHGNGPGQTDNQSTVTWGGLVNANLLLNLPLSTNTAPNPATMLVYTDSSKATQVGQADYNGADTGVACAIVYNGTTYYKVLTNGDLFLS